MGRCISLATLTKALQANTDVLGDGEVISIEESLKNSKWFFSFELAFMDRERDVLIKRVTLDVPMCCGEDNIKKTPSELIKGDIFRYKGFQLVAIDTWQDGYIWVTSPQYYIKPGMNVVYGYTSASIETIDENEVLEVTGNMEER